MKRIVLALGLLAAGGVAAQAQTFYHYECKDGASFEVGFYPGTKDAFLQFDGKALDLPKRFSLTSQRFSKNGVTFSDEARRPGDHQARRQDLGRLPGEVGSFRESFRGAGEAAKPGIQPSKIFAVLDAAFASLHRRPTTYFSLSYARRNAASNISRSLPGRQVDFAPAAVVQRVTMTRARQRI